jgi:hypothetical protein
MTAEEEKFVKFWAPKSKLGRFKYSVYTGALTFGLITWVGSLAFGQFLFDKPATWERALVGLPIWLLTGFFAFGWFQWPNNEKRYQRLINPEQKEDARATDGA